MLHITKVLDVLCVLALLPQCLHCAHPVLPALLAKSTPMAQALRHFNDVFFAERTAQLALEVVFERNDAQYYFNDLLYELVRPLLHLKVTIASRDFVYFSYYSVLMVDSYRSFTKIDPGRRSKNKDFSEFYLIVLHGDADATEMQRIFDYCWRHYIINVDVLWQSGDDNLALYTYFPFSATHCRSAVPWRLDVDGAITALSADELFPAKLNNLHGCSLVAVLWNVPPYLILPDLGDFQFDGMEGRLLVMLAEMLNFSITYITPPNNEQRGLVLRNGSVTGAMKIVGSCSTLVFLASILKYSLFQLKEKKGDLSLGSFRCTFDRSTALSPSISFYQTMQVFTVLSVHEAWSTYEILAYPFDCYVWSSLLGLLSSLFVGAFAMQRWKLDALKFFYGFRSSSFIVLNLTAATIGQQSYQLPRRNFARFLVIMWLLLTLVLRSAYQGLLYDFLSSQKMIAPPDTMTELSIHGFKLVVNVATNDSFSGVPIVRDKLLDVVVLNITDAGGYPILEQNRTTRYATGTPLDFLVHYVNSNSKHGVFHVVKEPIFPQQLCIYFTKHSFLTNTFNEILLNLYRFGILDYWAESHIGEIQGYGPSTAVHLPLTMSQLYGIFQIQYYLWIFAALVLIGELLWFRRCSP